MTRGGRQRGAPAAARDAEDARRPPRPRGGDAWTWRLACREELDDVGEWLRVFDRAAKPGRYYELVEATLPIAGEQRYVVLRGPHGRVRAVQPLFVVDQDVFEGCGPAVRRAVAALRRLLAPRLGTVRTLMVGSAAGDGELGVVAREDLAAAAEALHRALPSIAAEVGARLIVLKEFGAEYRPVLAPFAADGYTRIPSMPRTRLAIGRYASFDELMRLHLARSTRRSLRRKLRDADTAGGLELEVLVDASHLVDELYPLYRNVLERSPLRFEELTPAYLAQLGRALPERVRFFVWRHRGRVVAFDLCLVHGDEIHDQYLGLDYDAPRELNLYFATLRDIVDWAIRHGYRTYVSNPLAYHPKRRLRCRLVPLDLYVAHTNRVVNALLRPVLPLLTPVRRDPVLKTFPDYPRLLG
jgi:hypothetical protein